MNKVAFDLSPLSSGHKIRGVGFYTRFLKQALENRKNKKDLEVVCFDFNQQRDTLKKYNLIHYPYFNLFSLSLPFLKTTKIVVTIHDLIPLLYPSNYPPGIRGNFFLKIQKLLLKQVDGIITDTKTSKKDIVRLFKIDPERVYCIYLAPAEHFRKINNRSKLESVRAKFNLPGKFVLYVGDVNYNKNLITLAKACKLIKIPLVIVGKQAVVEEFDGNHPEMRHWAKFLAAYGQDPNIKRVGYISDEELVCFYNLASTYCQSSLYEGFGLPILEAMASCCPVVIADTPALTEISGQAVLKSSPLKAEDFAGKITQVLSKPALRSDLIKKGQIQVKKFSWKKTAEETIKVYRDII